MLRSPLLSPARTRNDRRMRNRFLLAVLNWIVGAFAVMLLPSTLQGYAAGLLALLITASTVGFVYWTWADWRNRATMSKDEARVRKARARILGDQ